MKNIHHIGIAVPAIKDAIEFHVNALDMIQLSKIVHDPIQKVRVVLLGYQNLNQNHSTPYIELIEPADKSSPIDNILQQKNHLYHYCIEVTSVENAIEQARTEKSLIIQKPVPAVLFDYRKIAWIWSPSQYLLEFLEKKTN